MVSKIIILLFMPLMAFAQDLSPEPFYKGVLSSLLYGGIGFCLLVLGYKIFDLISPIDFVKEIKDEHNVAAAILAGSLMIGLGIIMASAIS